MLRAKREVDRLLEAGSDDPKHMSSNAWLNRTGLVIFFTQCSGANILADVTSFPITGDANRVSVELVFLEIGGRMARSRSVYSCAIGVMW